MHNVAWIKQYDNRKYPVHASQEERKVDEVKVPPFLLGWTFCFHRGVTRKSQDCAYDQEKATQHKFDQNKGIEYCNENMF